MRYTTSQEHEALRAVIREFAETEVKPIAFMMDKENEFPHEAIKKLGEMGYMGIPYEKKYGGAGLDALSYAIAVEELSRVDGGTGVILSAHTSLGAYPIAAFGTEEQKKKYLVPLAKGEKIGAFGLTEPNAGTDAAMQQTIAEDKGDHYVLNGSKVFISGGGIADVYVIMAMTDQSKGTKGISAFIVEKGTPGFYKGRTEDKMGIRGSIVSELVFDDCIVPKENLLGELGKGFKVAMTSLDVGRLGIAAQALGIAQGAFDMTVEYMQHREQFGKKLSGFQAMAFEMAEMETRIDASRLLLYKAAYIREKGLPETTESAAKAKLSCSSTAMDVTVKAVQFHGGYGYIKDLPIERYMRDAKITQIYEGTSEVMKLVISGKIFPKKKAPKEEKAPVVLLDTVDELIETLADVKKDDIVCAGGRGFRKTESLELVEKLAEVTGGTFAASRGAVSMGWADEEVQVGLTGKKVTPDIYIACGISGMNQHLAGMKNSSLIVAINKNPKAPIFKAADFGIVGNVYDVLPELIEKWNK